MSKQSQLIGPHPDDIHPIGKWLECRDLPVTVTKCHRELTQNLLEDEIDFIEWMAQKVIDHHYTDFRIQRLKEKYKELGYEKYAEQHRKLPEIDKVKKGNATEILLVEYLESTQQKKLTKVFKLKYNPNVDQSIKGDDTLLVDLYRVDGVDYIKVFLGESKFRKTSSPQAVRDISDSLDKEKMPLSYTFLVEELAKTDVETAKKLDNFIIQDIKDNEGLIYVGLLLSDIKTSKKVEKNLANDNPSLVFISAGIDDPEEFINLIFIKANELLANPINL